MHGNPTSTLQTSVTSRADVDGWLNMHRLSLLCNPVTLASQESYVLILCASTIAVLNVIMLYSESCAHMSWAPWWRLECHKLERVQSFAFLCCQCSSLSLLQGAVLFGCARTGKPCTMQRSNGRPSCALLKMVTAKDSQKNVKYHDITKTTATLLYKSERLDLGCSCCSPRNKM